MIFIFQSKIIDYDKILDLLELPDIYFTPEYHKIWENNTNDGIAKIFIFKDENLGEVYYPYMMRPCSVFTGSEEYTNVYEAISNYG